MQPLISIIIPCYNVAPFIEKCVQSLLIQTFKHFELLLINDGSIDNSLELCNEISKKDNRVKIFSHENRGVSYTRNGGIENAEGEWIMFVDGDDWVDSDMLEKLHEVLNNSNELAICGMTHYIQGKKFKNEFFEYWINSEKTTFEKSEFLKLFPYSGLSTPCCKLYNKQILLGNNIRFEENISFQEDIIFNLQYLKFVERVKLVPIFAYHYVEYGISSNKYHSSLEYGQEIIYKLLKGFPDFDNKDEKLIIFFADQNLKSITNTFHGNSNLNNRQKIKRLKSIILTERYNSFIDNLNLMPINPIFKFILKLKNSYVIWFFFKAFKTK